MNKKGISDIKLKNQRISKIDQNQLSLEFMNITPILEEKELTYNNFNFQEDINEFILDNKKNKKVKEQQVSFDRE